MEMVFIQNKASIAVINCMFGVEIGWIGVDLVVPLLVQLANRVKFVKLKLVRLTEQSVRFVEIMGSKVIFLSSYKNRI